MRVEEAAGEGCASAPAPQAGNDQPGGSGLRALSAEDKGRIGQLIKVLAQERRDKECFRQELDQEKVKLQELQKERDSGRQQERALVARVSSALQLLRKYQQELYVAHGRDRSESRGRGDSQLSRNGGSRAGMSQALPPPTSAPVRHSFDTQAVHNVPPAATQPTPHLLTGPNAGQGHGATLAASSPRAVGSHSRGDVGMPGHGQPPASGSASKVSPPPSPESSSASERPRLRSPSPAVLASAAAVQPVQASEPEVEVPVLTPASSHASTGRHSRFTSLGVLQQPQLKLLQRYLHIQQGGDGSAAERAVAAAAAAAASGVASEAGEDTIGRHLVRADESSSIPGGTHLDAKHSCNAEASGNASIGSSAALGSTWQNRTDLASLGEDPSFLVVTPATPPASSTSVARAQSPAAYPGHRPAAPVLTPLPTYGHRPAAPTPTPVTPPAATAANYVLSPVAQPGWKPAAPAPGAVPTPSLFPPSLGAESTQRVSASFPRASPQHEQRTAMTVDKATPGNAHGDALTSSLHRSRSPVDGLRRSSRSPVVYSSVVSWGHARPPQRGRSGSPRRSTERASRQPSATPSASSQRLTRAAELHARARTPSPHNRPRSPQVTQSPEPLLESPSLPRRSLVQHRASRGSSLGATRSSWAVSIDDGYYGPAMFDVLDSVESAISLGSSFLSSTAGSTSSTRARQNMSSLARRAARDNTAAQRGGEHGGEELRRLQRELAELEQRVYGPTATAGAASSTTEAAFLSSSRDAVGSRGSFSHEPFPPQSPPRPLQRTSFAEGRGTPAPADVAPSTPPRKSREFDVCSLWHEAPRASASPAPAPPFWPAMPRSSGKVTSSACPPKLDEIDDVLQLLQKAPAAERAEG